MSDNKNLPAFPDTMRAAPQSYLNQNPESWPTGLSKREYFAAMAMQGYLSNSSLSIDTTAHSIIAVDAVKYADTLLAELSKS